jgi:hypothetical protein
MVRARLRGRHSLMARCHCGCVIGCFGVGAGRSGGGPRRAPVVAEAGQQGLTAGFHFAKAGPWKKQRVEGIVGGLIINEALNFETGPRETQAPGQREEAAPRGAER